MEMRQVKGAVDMVVGLRRGVHSWSVWRPGVAGFRVVR